MPRLNVPLRNKILGSGLADAFDGGTLKFYDATRPATSNLAPTGTLLATVTLPADALAVEANGSIAKNGTWSFTGVAASDATWARFCETGDDDSLDGDFHRMDVSVSATGGGGELTLDNVSIAVGQNGSVSTFTFTMPAGS